jgi:hypothetical protein
MIGTEKREVSTKEIKRFKKDTHSHSIPTFFLLQLLLLTQDIHEKYFIV